MDRKKKRQKRNSYAFLIENKEIMIKLIPLIVITLLIIVFFFFLVFFSKTTKVSDLFLLDVREFLTKNFWLPFIFVIIWGFLFIRVSYGIAVQKLIRPFTRFQKHMDIIAHKKEKDFFIHRSEDYYMHNMSSSFNKMIDNLFEEIENRQEVIKKLRRTIEQIYQDKKYTEKTSLEEALDYKEYTDENR